MWPHYLLALYRSLTRHRLYAALNILGLAVGIAVFVVLMLFVRFETSFDAWIPGASNIYVVRSVWTLPGVPQATWAATMGGLLEELEADYPQVKGVRLSRRRVTVQQGAVSRADRTTYVDPDFFTIFPLPLAVGDPRTALSDPSGLVVTQATARRYFGAENPMGRALTISVEGQSHVYRVTGVLRDIPKNTDFKIEMLARLVPAWFDKDHHFYHWGSSSLATYLAFPNAAAARSLAADLDRFTDRHAAGDLGASPAPHTFLHFDLTPLPRLHLIEPAAAATTAALGVVGLLTLLIAILNYVNLATVQTGARAREAALRKVLGAPPRALMAQFLAEAVAMTALAALIGLALCEATLPLVNAAGGSFLRLRYFGHDGLLAPLILLVVVVGLSAGWYPALILARAAPAAVLASARSPGGGRAGARLREALVLAQFAVAASFAVCTAVLAAQTHYLQTADLGFRRDGLIEVRSFANKDLSASERASLIDAYRALAGVASVTQAENAPGENRFEDDSMRRPGQTGEPPTIGWTMVGPDFFSTYGARLLAGRLLEPSRDDIAGKTRAERDQGVNVVLNARAVKSFGFAGPKAALGQTVLQETDEHTWRPSMVVGVVADMRFHSPHAAINPMLYTLKSRDLDQPVATIRFADADPATVMARMAAAWRGIAPEIPFQARTVGQSLDPYYRPDEERARLFTIGAVLAVAIGCFGLYGLAAFNTARRVKEIGIRKTLGASTGAILRLLLGQFLRPVVLANLIAWPIAYFAMRSWLAGFHQRIALSPIYFLDATLLTLAIAAGTVAFHALQAARSDPAQALRRE